MFSSWIIVRVWNYKRNISNHGTEILLMMIKYYIILSLFIFPIKIYNLMILNRNKKLSSSKARQKKFWRKSVRQTFSLSSWLNPLLLHSITVLKCNDMHTKQGLDANFRTKKYFWRKPISQGFHKWCNDWLFWLFVPWHILYVFIRQRILTW